MLLLRLSLWFFFVIVTAQADDSEVTKFMKHLEVIPDVISAGPKDFLKVTFESGVTADKGVELTPTQVKSEPKVEWNAEPDTFYTLISSDPDAPSRKEPKYREWLHWLVVNIPGNDLSKGEVLAGYVSAGPPEGTDLHRYVFLLYKQPKKLEFDETPIKRTSTKGRTSFSTMKFVEKYKLGTPEQGNFYQAKYDSYVPELYKMFEN